MDDFVLAGANGVNTAGQLFDPSTQVGIDSPGGAGAIVMNAMLSGIGEPRDVDEIPTQRIIESFTARTTEWAEVAWTQPSFTTRSTTVRKRRWTDRC